MSVMNPLITLTTDFGAGSAYVAALKGAILTVNPEARLVDLSHAIGPQDLIHAALFLTEAVPYYPAGTLHLVVVDPGVGTERGLLYVEVDDQRLLVPDNGLWTPLAQGRRIEQVRRLTEARYWRPAVSPTFHGRDILAPVAGHLSRGLDPAALGPLVQQSVELRLPEPSRTRDGLRGEVLWVDCFGNLITNIRESPLVDAVTIRVGDRVISRRVRTYGEAAPGELVFLISSGGWLEVAVVQGNAAERLGARRGAPVEIVFSDASQKRR